MAIVYGCTSTKLGPVVDLDEPASFLLKNILPEVLSDGVPPRLPPPAPGSGLSPPTFAEIAAGQKTIIWAGAKSDAWLAPEQRTINFTHGWVCDRWCSTHLLLRSLVLPPAAEEPLIRVVPREHVVTWPEEVPLPCVETDALVRSTNRVFPWVVLPTLLHEVGHTVEGKSGLTGPPLELACDAFAVRYLLGTRKDQFHDIVLLGLAIWLCCLCSEGLANNVAIGKDHPNPVDRIRQYLVRFVPRQTEMGQRVWMLCTSHVMRLTRVHGRPALDTHVLTSTHRDLEDLLKDLRTCWD